MTPDQREGAEARLADIVTRMRSETPRYKSHDLGYVDSVAANAVDEWADEIEAILTAQSAPVEAGHREGWQDISTAPKDGTLVVLWMGDYVEPIAVTAVWHGDKWLIGKYATVDNPTHWAVVPPPPQEEGQ